MIEGFPNLLMMIGPHAGLGNFPRAAKYSVECVTGLVRFAHDRGVTRAEATAAGVVQWTEHVLSLGEGLLMNEIDSWMTGVNRNVEGKQTRKIMRYSGGSSSFTKPAGMWMSGLRSRPPASRRRTEALLCVASRPATSEPADPPPTTMKS
jgi:hypothetical protein